MGWFGSKNDDAAANEIAVNWGDEKLKERQQRKEEERRKQEEAERKMIEDTFHGKDDE